MGTETTVVYARMSTRKQQSDDWQIEWGKKVCKDRGWPYGGEYREPKGSRHSDDISFSGRPALRQLLEDAVTGKFFRVVVWDHSRIARGDNLLLVLDYLGLCHVKVHMGDVPDAGDSTELLISFFSGLDKYFLKQLRKNTKRGIQEAREKGKRMKPPVGFKNSDDSKRLIEELWARNENGMREMGFSASKIKRVKRNIRLSDSGELEEFLSTQHEKASKRYKDAKARADNSNHEFELWLNKIRPARSSERVSL